MDLKYLQKLMILPDEEIILNKAVSIKGTLFNLVSIAKQDDKVILYAVYDGGENVEDDTLQTTYTMRNRLMKDVALSNRESRRFIREISVQGQSIAIKSSRLSRIHHNNFIEFMKLQHFKDIGWDSTLLDEVPVTNLEITEYEFRDVKHIPSIDTSKDLDLCFTFGQDIEQAAIGKKMRISFGEKGQGNSYTFYDQHDEKEYTFYINSLKHYDIWNEWESIFDNEHMRAQPREVVDELKKRFLETLNEECPKNMDFVIIEYESPDDLDLQFYSVESLDKKRELKLSSSSSASAVAFIVKPDHETGINGYKAKSCMVTAIEKRFDGELDIELFSRTIRVPEERIFIER